MNNSEKMYEIILDVWKFAHKYEDKLADDKKFDWDALVDEYSKIAGDKSEEEPKLLGELRCNLFLQVFKYFQKHEKEVADNV